MFGTRVAADNLDRNSVVAAVGGNCKIAGIGRIAAGDIVGIGRIAAGGYIAAVAGIGSGIDSENLGKCCSRESAYTVSGSIVGSSFGRFGFPGAADFANFG